MDNLLDFKKSKSKCVSIISSYEMVESNPSKVTTGRTQVESSRLRQILSRVSPREGQVD